jgi:MoaA/NifB/PqqE/SkfB family radical SAM enzyme
MLKDTFCSSPWFHLRMNYSGNFVPCRWFKQPIGKSNFNDTSIMKFYNSEEMKNLRTSFLSGNEPMECTACYFQDSHNKLSGRIKQLNKIGIIQDHFELSFLSSPHYKNIKYSQENFGESLYEPVDLQIDLGNTCNSACIMCTPFASSRLLQDYKKLHKINYKLFENPKEYKSWTKDPVLLQKFVDEISSISNLKYIHFLGGETLYDPAFYKICEKLVEVGISKNIIVGTTTNGTIYDDKIEPLIRQFKEFHLGISIEAISTLNDYIRYPSNVSDIIQNIKKFLSLRDDTNLYISLRITPNIFSISEIDKLFEFMIENNVTAESCNILTDPSELRIELLPEDIRQETINKLNILVEKYQLQKTDQVNIRSKDLIQEVNSNVLIEYKSFLENYKIPDNVEVLRYQLIDFLKSFESLRNNSILDYAPRYKDFLRTYGY